MARYIHRVYPEKAIDYAIFSHWHWDHVGTFENHKKVIDAAVTKIVARYRKLYPEKPIIVSELGTVARSP